MVKKALAATLAALIALGCSRPDPASSPEASRDVARAAAKAGPGYECWAETNDQMPEGYEVLCKHL